MRFPIDKTYSAKLTHVRNKDSQTNENRDYYHMRVRGDDFLFSRHAMTVARLRALRQPEDNRSRNLFQRLLIDWWKR